MSVYLGAGALTARLTGRPLRVLYDGFAPPAPYQWVNPPKELQAGNVVPGPTTRRVDLGPGGSARASIGSTDGQLVLNLSAGAVPTAEGQARAAFTLTPLDPATLAPLPSLSADGNAYRVDVAYEPSAAAVAAFAAPVDVLVVVPQPTDALFTSADGQAWQPLATQSISSTSAAAPVGAPGYFLAGAAAAVPAGPAGSDLARTLVAVLVTALLAAALWAAPLALDRIRRR